LSGEGSIVRGPVSFVGRQLESEWLAARFEEAASGTPTLALISGDAGMGKTRLMRESSRSFEKTGSVIWGHSYEYSEAPYLPISEALRAAFERFPEAAASLDESERESLRQIAGGAPAAQTATQDTGEGQLGQAKLFLAVSQFLLAACRERPLALIFDDLHWLDPPSLDLITHLVFALADRSERGGLPLLLCAAYRAPDLPARTSAVVDRWQREQICHSLHLEGLAEREVAALVGEMGYRRPSQQLIRTLLEVTRGNPLFVQEAIFFLRNQGALAERGGSLVTSIPPADIRLPQQLTEAIAQRVSLLDATGRAVLELGALLGDTFAYDKLEAVSAGEIDVRDGVEKCVGGGFLADQGSLFALRHPLIRQVVYTTTPGIRRRQIHRRIADVLEARYTERTDEQVGEIAHHMEAAGDAVEAERALAYARLAGDGAMRVFAWAEAARNYEMAVEASKRIAGFPRPEFSQLSLKAAFAYYRNLDVGPCLHHLDQAIPVFQETNDLQGLTAALALRTRCHLTQVSVAYGEMVDLASLEEIVDKVANDAPEIAGEALATISQAYWTGRRPAQAREAAVRALEMGERSGNASISARAESSLALSCLQSLDLKEAYDHWSKSLQFAREGGDLWAQGWPLVRIPLVLIWQGDLAAAETAFAEARTIIRQTQDITAYSLALAALVCINVARGEFARAEEHAGEAIRAIQRSHYPWAGPIFLPALACARAVQGDFAEAADALALLTTPGKIFDDPGRPIVSSVRTYNALVEAYAGDTTRATAFVRQDWDPSREADMATLSTLGAAIELSDLLSMPPGAGLLETFRASMTKGVMLTTGWMFLIPRVLGLAAAASGQETEAEGLFQQAIGFAATNGARLELGRACLDYASLLTRRGSRGDAEQADDLLRRARRIFAEIGAHTLDRRGAALQAGGHTPVAVDEPVSTYPDRLTEREVQVLLLVARGNTNQGIADALVLSPKTVARHISNIFDKVGVDNRSAATAYAFEQGLAAARPPQRRE
jgi:DNA-binding CsgD family transcriptional regulator/tetratricopeptide (TPR) repeat protein